ncbi:MAG: OmpA family protein [Melioribacteraceae bacterium]
MKKLLTILLMLITITTFAQENDDSVYVYKSGWNLSLSGTYPRYMAVSFPTIANHKNYGASISLGYDVSEHIGFRLLGNFISLDSYILQTGQNGAAVEDHNIMNQLSLNLDVIYKLLPCERFIPYVMLGYGYTNFESDNGYLDRFGVTGRQNGYQLRFGGGLEWRFSDDLSFKIEGDYATASNNRIDGNDHINETKGLLRSNGDTYMTADLGVIWYFSRGDRSTICEPYGIREVEVVKEIEVQTIDTVYVDKIIEKAVTKREAFVLENVKFKFDKDILTTESKMILDRVATVLNRFPEEGIEILGHTDNIGDDLYNMDLSERRAVSVKNYLISQGVDGNRLYPAGCGERKPVVENTSAIGRAINRRIEFSIYDGVTSACPKYETQSERNGANINDAISNGEALVLEGVHFKFNSDELTSESTTILANAASVLSQYPNAPIEIHGHTDSIGDEAYNKDLSLRRAISVKNYLASKGIAKSRMSTYGHGEGMPIDDNGTAYGRARNRRMEFKLTGGYEGVENTSGSSTIYEESSTVGKTVTETTTETVIEEASSSLSAEAKKMEAQLLSDDKFVLNNLNFVFDKDILVEKSKQILFDATSVLKKHSNISVRIEGHTDNIGADDYNQYLSIMRSNAVKRYLIENGISKSRLTTKGFGEKNPIATNKTSAGRALNRRIEFNVVR